MVRSARLRFVDSRLMNFATRFAAPDSEVSFTFEGDTSAMVDKGSVARSSIKVTWTGVPVAREYGMKPFAQVWIAAKPIFAPTQDIFLGFHALETATQQMAAQLIADVLQVPITVAGQSFKPRKVAEFLSRRLYVTDAEYQKALNNIKRLQKR